MPYFLREFFSISETKHLEYLCDLCPAFYATEPQLWKHTLESHIHSEENDYFAETR